ncbi:MAG: MoaD/ThiS family protein [Thauera sp.]|nr:MoaD/ThiS family protein [Thauera sp.]
MNVLVPSPLRSYTASRIVEAEGECLDDLLIDLDRQYPGIRFRMVDEQGRIRPHLRFFLQGRQLFDLRQKLEPDAELTIVQALSGG